MRYRPALKYIFLWLITPPLSLFFPVIGTPLLRVLERVHGQALYWLTGLGILGICAATGVMDLFFMFVSMWICQGVYGLLESRGRAGLQSAMLSIFAGTAGFFLTLGILLGDDFKKFFTDTEAALTQLMADLHFEKVQIWGNELSPKLVLELFPAMIGIIVLSGLACSLILDRRVALLTNMRFNQIVSHIRLMQFRLPPSVLWIFLLSTLVGLLAPPDTAMKITTLNLSCFLFAAYFFQGLAVIEAGLLYFRVGPLMRILFYILVVGNLFLLVSLLGIADFWLDLRQKMKREKKT